MSAYPLATVFLEAWPDGHAWSDHRPELDAALRALLDASEETDLAIDTELVAFVAARVSPDADALEEIRHLRGADLRLACACLKGDARALELFSQRFGQLVRNTLGRMGKLGLSNEVEQLMLERLLVGDDERPGALALYSGRGPLDAYLRVAVTRAALRLDRRHKREVSNNELVDRAVADVDPETAALRARYGPVVKTSFQDAIETLTSRDRRLLRYHYVEHLTVRQMGVLLGVHHSTVTRQLAQTRARLLKAARAQLSDALGGSAEVSGIVRFVESQLDLSLERVLATQTE